VPEPAPVDRAALVFDGDCAFCSSTARLLRRHVPARAAIVPWQRADLAALGLTAADCEQAVQWVEPGVRRSAGALAFAHYLQAAGPPWRWLGRLLGLRPAQAVARPAYTLIARNRHRLPGGAPACRS
jgi:predicted DCC family thiol-disulfide oxidoreductase YuxK